MSPGLFGPKFPMGKWMVLSGTEMPSTTGNGTSNFTSFVQLSESKSVSPDALFSLRSKSIL